MSFSNRNPAIVSKDSLQSLRDNLTIERSQQFNTIHGLRRSLSRVHKSSQRAIEEARIHAAELKFQAMKARENAAEVALMMVVDQGHTKAFSAFAEFYPSTYLKLIKQYSVR